MTHFQAIVERQEALDQYELWRAAKEQHKTTVPTRFSHLVLRLTYHEVLEYEGVEVVRLPDGRFGAPLEAPSRTQHLQDVVVVSAYAGPARRCWMPARTTDELRDFLEDLTERGWL